MGKMVKFEQQSSVLFKLSLLFIGFVFISIVTYYAFLGVVAYTAAKGVSDYCDGLNAAECLGKSVNDYNKKTNVK